MKFLATRVCTNPKLTDGKLILSYDHEIWKDSCQFNNIKHYYNDQYGRNIFGNDFELIQPKNEHGLAFAVDGFLPCVLAVDDNDLTEWTNANQIYPATNIYNNTNLYFLGYDVMDLCFISIKSHGISAEYKGDYAALNKYGLFELREICEIYLQENLKLIPEHSWKLVGIYTNKKSIDIINKILLGMVN